MQAWNNARDYKLCLNASDKIFKRTSDGDFNVLLPPMEILSLIGITFILGIKVGVFIE